MVFLTQEALLVHDALLRNGLENPLIWENVDSISDSIREAHIAKHILSIMNILNLDLKNNSLVDTPKRIAKMYIKEFFYGLNYINFPKITFFDNKTQIDETIVIRNVSVISMCEHHFIVFYGVATVAYVPCERIIGLSKVNRIVDFFSRRPQVQERLNKQIFLALQMLLDTKNVAVSINAMHFCVKARGMRDNSNMVTTALGGIFKSNQHIRDEFFRRMRCYHNS